MGCWLYPYIAFDRSVPLEPCTNVFDPPPRGDSFQHVSSSKQVFGKRSPGGVVGSFDKESH